MHHNVYLAGEIHSDWRSEIIAGAEALELPLHFTAPVTDHALSDDCGAIISGPEEKQLWHDRKGAGVNGARTSILIQKADLVVVKFGEQYKQWNAAFDAGIAHALGKPLILIRPEGFIHALKEIERAAHAAITNSKDAVSALEYITKGTISGR